ncbi:MAG: GNAT family N-acetyltransferase [Trueperaceae bacterium]
MSAVLPNRPGSGFTSPRMRDATTADLGRLADLWARARPEAGVGKAALKAWLDSGRALLLEDAAGCALAALRYREEDGGWRVEPIVTDPGQRGQGFGRWLMTALEANAIRENVAFLALDVADRSTLSYYRRLGYRPSGDNDLQLRKRVGGMWQQQELD